jgi:hypothetical protein
VVQLLPEESSWLDYKACYRALELCRVAMAGEGQQRLDFSDWFWSELGPMLRVDLAEDVPVAMRAMKAWAIQVAQAYLSHEGGGVRPCL